MSFTKSASYISSLVDSAIILQGANWNSWSIGITENPEGYEYCFEASSFNEAKIAVDFIAERRRLNLAEEQSGKYVFITQAI